MLCVILLFLTVESRLFDLQGIPHEGHEPGINNLHKESPL